MKKIIEIIAVVLIYTAISALPASAAPPKQSFMVSPAKLEVSAKPGESQIKVVKVANQGDSPVRITASLADYFIRPDNTFIFFKPGHKSYSSARWIKVEKTDFELLPGEAQNVRIKVTVPKKAETGGHYAGIFFQNRQKKPGNGISIVARIGVLLLSTVGNEADINRNGEIKEFSAKNSWLEPEVTTKLLFNNSGNVHLSLKGKVAFTDLFGRKVGRADLPEMTVLPGTDRIMTTKWTGPVFGRFTAKANVQYGRDLSTYDRTIKSKEVSFWIVPWRPLLAGIGLIMFAWLVRAAVKSRKRGYTPRHAAVDRV